MNRYELGHRSPDFLLAEKLAKVLDVPTPYLYCSDDRLTHLIEAYDRLNSPGEASLLKATHELA